MTTIGVIPARLGSTRFPGKVLADIAGKSMIQHVWDGAKKSKLLDDLIIACDDEKILKVAKSFGAKAVLTSGDHSSGSDRIAEAVENLDVDIIVNIQADEPFIQPSVIDHLVEVLKSDASSVMATVVKIIENPEDCQNPNVVKVVLDDQKNALYFSRSLIPYNRGKEKIAYYKHLGIYAYRKDFLFKFKNLPKSNLEKIEQLEQLRVLEAGYKIKTVLTDVDSIGVDTPEDLERVKSFLKGK